MSVIDHKLGFVFIANARTGSTSMLALLDDITRNNPRHYLGLNAGPCEYHMGLKDTIKIHPDATEYFKFCFTRNPWTRFLSAYREFINRAHYPWNQEICNYDTFDKFCLAFPNLEIANDIHFKPIINQCSIAGINCMDYVARFENYDSELKIILEMIGCSKPPNKKYHSRQTSGKKYQEMYSNQGKKNIASFYEEDIDTFKYSF